MEPTYDKKFCLDHGPTLYNEIDWIKVQAKRSECFMAKSIVDYQYVDGGHIYQSVPFHPLVEYIMHKVNSDLRCNLNVCFANRYEDEKDALGWHSDDAFSIDQAQPIAVVSFGAEREIWWKPIGFKSPSIFPKEWRCKLENGSLFTMPAGMQDTHMHKIPKHDSKCDWRISLTFRALK